MLVLLTTAALAQGLDGGDPGTSALDPLVVVDLPTVQPRNIPVIDDGGLPDADGDGVPTGIDCNDNNPNIGGPFALFPDADGDSWGNPDGAVFSCNLQLGFVGRAGDCDDTDGAVYDGAPEICDGKDNDCDGNTDENVLNTYWHDADNDGRGDPNDPDQACSAPQAHVANSNDCNDNDATIYLNAPELCDNKDNDCDGLTDENVTTTYWYDGDGDGQGASGDTLQACSAPAAYVTNSNDCDDGDAAVYLGAPESCDLQDNDCDGLTDENVTNTYWHDADNDGRGDPNDPTQACSAPQAHVSNSNDCDDTDATVYLGAPELCDSQDNDCDGNTDEGVTSTYWHDADNDGRGDPNDPTQACSTPAAHVTNSNDCDDADATVYLGAPELCDGQDNDCDDTTDEGVTSTYWHDADNDGRGDPNDPTQACSAPAAHVSNSNDCDDTDATVYQGAPELCDSQDNDCDGNTDEGATSTFYGDADSDQHGDPLVSVQACSAPSGYVSSGDDCNDANGSVHPGATEICNDQDEDCDGNADEGLAVSTWYLDADGDGAGGSTSVQDCSAPSGYVAANDDCDDADPSQKPGVAELCNDEDDDCDGTVDESATDALTWYLDDDGDGFGGDTTTLACEAPPDHVANADDCDDNRPLAFPGADEQCNGADDDCDGTVDEDTTDTTFYLDADGDGFGVATTTVIDCAPPSGYAETAGDCDDGDPTIRPGAAEVCDGADNDCDGTTDQGATDASWFYPDDDDDSHGDDANAIQACSAPTGFITVGGDCDDTEPLAWTDAPELCDGVDNDCDGVTDPDDATDAATFWVDLDDDGYGAADAPLQACAPPPGTATNDADCNDLNDAVNPDAAEVCDTLDNDCDGLVDVGAIDPQLFYEDLDEDGFGSATEVLACQQTAQLALQAGDCDDTEPTTNPDAYDLCDDGVDNNCDGGIDENTAVVTWYQDLDGDNVGTNAATVESCSRPTEGSWATVSGDCDDDDPTVRPQALEICDGVDNDCDNQVDDNPIDGQIHYLDLDDDGYGDPLGALFACYADETTFWVANAADCDDNDASVNPMGLEVCDGVDNDCDGAPDDNAIDGRLYYRDADDDGYGTNTVVAFACTAPPNSSQATGDCDDGNPGINPFAAEVCGGLDDDCDGLIDDQDTVSATSTTAWYPDNDDDGFGAGLPVERCEAPDGYVDNQDDCNDGTAGIHPEATDIPGNGIDEDCDGVDPDPTLDSDGDGVPDLDELQMGSDPTRADSDGDGIPDGDEERVDTDGDGLSNLIDEDDDGDGLLSADEGTDDFDGDGIPNYLDDDSDNDGVPDGLETGDADGDGTIDALDSYAGGEPPEPPSDKDYGCGCASGPGAPWWLGLALVPLARRRRELRS